MGAVDSDRVAGADRCGTPGGADSRLEYLWGEFLSQKNGACLCAGLWGASVGIFSGLRPIGPLGQGALFWGSGCWNPDADLLSENQWNLLLYRLHHLVLSGGICVLAVYLEAKGVDGAGRCPLGWNSLGNDLHVWTS